jgi:hypothetical protein
LNNTTSPPELQNTEYLSNPLLGISSPASPPGLQNTEYLSNPLLGISSPASPPGLQNTEYLSNPLLGISSPATTPGLQNADPTMLGDIPIRVMAGDIPTRVIATEYLSPIERGGRISEYLERDYIVDGSLVRRIVGDQSTREELYGLLGVRDGGVRALDFLVRRSNPEEFQAIVAAIHSSNDFAMSVWRITLSSLMFDGVSMVDTDLEAFYEVISHICLTRSTEEVDSRVDGLNPPVVLDNREITEAMAARTQESLAVLNGFTDAANGFTDAVIEQTAQDKQAVEDYAKWLKELLIKRAIQATGITSGVALLVLLAKYPGSVDIIKALVKPGLDAMAQISSMPSASVPMPSVPMPSLQVYPSVPTASASTDGGFGLYENIHTWKNINLAVCKMVLEWVTGKKTSDPS